MTEHLTHLTLNTGHTARTTRPETSQAVLDSLRPSIKAEGGPIPGLDGWYFDLFRPLDQAGQPSGGAAYFQIADEPGLSKRPAIVAVACWSPDLSLEAWNLLIGGYNAMRETLRQIHLWRPIPTTIPSTPWLAVYLTPFISLADIETAQMFGDIERCLAWGLME